MVALIVWCLRRAILPAMRRQLRTSDYLAGYAILSLIGYGIGWICWQAAGGAGLVALALFVFAVVVARLKP